MQRPSSAYSANLEPAPAARLLVLCSGVALTLAGLAAILTVPAPGGMRAILVLAWLLHGIIGICQRLLQLGRVSGFRIDADLGIELNPGRPDSREATLLCGTLVLRHAIWIRYADCRGRSGSELVPGSLRGDAEFRRACVILRLATARRNQ